MNKTLIGAVSMAALLAVGLSACGQQEKSEYGRTADDQTGSESSSGGTTDDQYAANQPGEGSESGGTEPAPNAGGLAPLSPGSTTAEATGDGMEVAIAEISSKDDAERVAGEAFDQADADRDGMLDRSEYMTLAMSAEHYGLAASAAPGAAGGEMPGTEPPDEMPSGEANAGGALPGAPDASQTAASDAMPAIDAAFAEAAGEDGSMTEEELSAAFLDRFEIADEDGDAQLNETERQTFAQLTAGAEPAQ